MKKLIKNNKGVFNQLGALGVGVAGLVVTLAVVFLILANVGANTDVAANGNATAAVNTLTTAAASIPGWVPLIILVAIGALILALVSRFGQ